MAREKHRLSRVSGAPGHWSAFYAGRVSSGVSRTRREAREWLAAQEAEETRRTVQRYEEDRARVMAERAAARDGLPVRYPEIKVRLSGHGASGGAIISQVRRAMRLAGVDHAEIAAFDREAESGDHAGLLRTVRRWVEVE